MKLLTRDTDYALRALVFISSRKGRIVSVSELVRCLKIPRPFLRKLLQILTKKKILISVRGSCGGFILKAPDGDIRLPDIMRVFQGAFSLNECVFKKHICPNHRRCVLREKIISIEQYLLKELNRITLKDIVPWGHGDKKKDKKHR